MFYERIIAACLATPWALHPDKLRVIEAFLARKARGETIPEREIQAAKQQQRKAGPTPPGGVGIVPIYGTITQRADLFTEWSGGTSTDEVGQRIDELAGNANVKAIVLDVDSPGGSVYGVAELGDKIRDAGKTKKVVAVVNSMAASGAYWIASQATEIVVTPNGEVGSIGVYQIHIDQSEALKLAGQAATVITAGERKAACSPYGPLGQLGRDELQGAVNDYYDKFTKAVARGRGRAQATVANGFGRGGMVRAEQAVEGGWPTRSAPSTRCSPATGCRWGTSRRRPRRRTGRRSNCAAAG